MDDSLAKCFSEARLGNLTIRNRLIKAATFENMSPGGMPGDDLTAFHRRIGEGGIGMTTLAYCAAEADGRLHEDMLFMGESIRTEITALIKAVKATGTMISGQLSHCGDFTRNREFNGRIARGPSLGINKLGFANGLPIAGALSLRQIKQRVAVFARAAGFMKSVGFDAIELHCGHGYGISQFISPKTNRRRDQYGGSLINRMRFALEVIEAVRKEVGESFPLLAKFSMADGVSQGVDYDESPAIARLLAEGGVDCIVCSTGTSSMNPMVMIRGESILPGLLRNESNPAIRLAMRLMSRRMFQHYPYEDIYLFDHARRIREVVDCAVCYVGGVSGNDNLMTLMKAGFDFVQIGRGLLIDPDFASTAQSVPNYRNPCTHCNQCVPLIDIKGGIYCPLNPILKSSAREVRTLSDTLDESLSLSSDDRPGD